MLLEQQLGVKGFAVQRTARAQGPDQLPRRDFLHKSALQITYEMQVFLFGADYIVKNRKNKC
jgi:hypothetical protein